MGVWNSSLYSLVGLSRKPWGREREVSDEEAPAVCEGAGVDAGEIVWSRGRVVVYNHARDFSCLSTFVFSVEFRRRYSQLNGALAERDKVRC